MAYLETTGGDPIGVLTQLSEATLEVTAESTDAVDKDGTLIKRFWKAKTGTFTATNAMLNLNVMGLMSGSDKKVASAQNILKDVPGLAIVKIGANQQANLAGYVDGTAKVNYLYNNGTMGDTVPASGYTITTSGDGTTFEITGAAPGDDINRVIVRYDRDATAGVAVLNKADKFPQTMRVILKVLVVDPCDWGITHSRHVQ